MNAKMTFHRVKTLVVAGLFVLLAAEWAAAMPIANISTQKIQGYQSGGGYSWRYGYDIGFDNLELNVVLGIQLTGYTPSTALKEIWENGIETMWNRKFDIVDVDGQFTYRYHVNFDVRFYSYATPLSHHSVKVISGTGRGNMLNWYTTTEWGEYYNGAYVAHEVGHMFGLYDEYSGGAVNNSNPIIDYQSIMGSLAYDAKSRHYTPFLNWLQNNAPERQLSIGYYDPTWVIPEPATFALLAFGAIILRHGISLKTDNRK